MALFWISVWVSQGENRLRLLIKRIGLEDFINHYNEFEKFNKILIIIPVFNEARNLVELLPRIPKEIDGQPIDVLIVDDGSYDTSLKVSLQSGAFVSRNYINVGGGVALQLGFEIALYGEAEIVVTMDADNQHLPDELITLITPLINQEADIVIGSRIKGEREKDSLSRYIGILFFNFIINFITGLKISDCSSNYRAFKAEVLQKVNLVQAQYHTSEFIIEGTKNKFKITEVPITVLKRKYGRTKKGGNLKYGLNFAKTIIKTWWK